MEPADERGGLIVAVGAQVARARRGERGEHGQADRAADLLRRVDEA
jgi:hypothetical protein